MPPQSTEPHDGHTPPGSRRRALFALLACGWLPVLLYAIYLADDPGEQVLNLVLLGLGLAATGAVATTYVRTSRVRLGRVERHLEVMGSYDLVPWECDAEGRITFVGEGIQEIFGYQPRELVGRDLSDVVHPSELARLAELVRRGQGWRQERWRCIVADGSERWFIGTAVPERTPDAALRGYTGSVQPLGSDAVDDHRLSEVAARTYARLASEDVLPVFQPILSVESGRLVGAEALTRFPGSDLTPDRWFTEAAEIGLGVELELLALRTSLAAAGDLPSDVYVSFNVSPDTLVRPELLEMLVAGPLSLSRIVLEITEHASISVYDELLTAVHELRRAGIRLAVDDAGAGYASFRHILRLTPEVIKLDRSLVAGIDDDPALRALATAVVSFGGQTGSSITAEGIETPEELRCLQELGIHSAQGYLFGRPTHDWSTWTEWHAHGPVYSVAAAGVSGSGG